MLNKVKEGFLMHLLLLENYYHFGPRFNFSMKIELETFSNDFIFSFMINMYACLSRKSILNIMRS